MESAEEKELKQAIEKFFRTTRADKGVLTGWVIVAHMYNITEEGDKGNYSLMTPGTDQFEHVTWGLLEAGRRMVVRI